MGNTTIKPIEKSQINIKSNVIKPEILETIGKTRRNEGYLKSIQGEDYE